MISRKLFNASCCLTILILSGCECCSFSNHPSLAGLTIVDLTYSFNEQTVYWPTATRFRLERVAYGYNESGQWYASNDFSASEHGGTHLDAPIHFVEGGLTTEEIPLARLMGPARVVDITAKCKDNPDYLLTPEDIKTHETIYGQIEPGDVVLIHTGYGKFYPNARFYLGSEVRGVVKDLHFPAIGAAAAQYLVSKKIDMVGLDTASLDHGPSKDFAAHRIFSEANIHGLENVANLDELPPIGSTVMALPMKIENGTGGPCRVIALIR